MPPYTQRASGAPNTRGHRVYIEHDGAVISTWHDIPVFADEANRILHMVVTSPRWTNASIELAMDEPLNPLMQPPEVKRKRSRYVRNCFPHHGFVCNFGVIPQTWSDPSSMSGETGARGTNTPLDVCEIGDQVAQVGQVKQVKLLGALALGDRRQLEWKIIAVDVTDPLADRLESIEDLSTERPGLLHALQEWLMIHRIPEGKSPKLLAFTGEPKGTDSALDIVYDSHDDWQSLVSGSIDAHDLPSTVSITNVTVENSPGRVKAEEVEVAADSGTAPARMSSRAQKWFLWHTFDVYVPA